MNTLNTLKATLFTLLVGVATTLSATNPNMPDYENFVQRCTLDGVQSHPVSDMLYHVIGSLGVKFFIRHTKRRDFVLFSSYDTGLNTYVAGTYRVSAFGLLNNFYATLESPNGQKASCF